MLIQAAEAQEALEKDSLANVESEVREELAQTLQGDDVSLCDSPPLFGIFFFFSFLIFAYHLSISTCQQLETAVADEMSTLIEEWETVLDELETESAHLLVCFFLQPLK